MFHLTFVGGVLKKSVMFKIQRPWVNVKKNVIK